MWLCPVLWQKFPFFGAMTRNDEANPPEAFLNDGIFACGDSLFKSPKRQSTSPKSESAPPWMYGHLLQGLFKHFNRYISSHSFGRFVEKKHLQKGLVPSPCRKWRSYWVPFLKLHSVIVHLIAPPQHLGVNDDSLSRDGKLRCKAVFSATWQRGNLPLFWHGVFLLVERSTPSKDWPSLASSPKICLFRAKANNSSELRLRMSWNNVKILVSFEDISIPATSQCFTIQHRLLFASFEVQLCQCNLDYLPQLSSSDRVK